MTIVDRQTLDIIIASVLYHFDGITKENICSKSRKHEFVEPRQIAQTLAYAFTNNKLEAVGHYIGNKNHATIVNSVKCVVTHYDMEKVYSSMIDSIIQMVNLKCGKQFSFKNIKNIRDVKKGKYHYNNQLLEQFNNKIQELLVTFHPDTILEVVAELKEIDKKINNQINTEAVLNEGKKD